jgi:NADPH2:quinone reductase
VGDRVAFSTGVQGSYAEIVAVPARHLVPVPPSVSLREASTSLEHGLTAMVLADDVARLDARRTLLVHAAAGGVGGWLVQVLRNRGHRVIGTASSAEKLAWLTRVGVEAVHYGEVNDWVQDVERLTGGAGVDVVFDSVGRVTFSGSLRVLAPRGHLVLFGAASGQPDPIDVLSLMAKSVTLTRPVMPHYLSDAESLRRKARAVFDAILGKAIEVRIHGEYALAQAADAHSDLASRNTAGKLLLSIAPELL